VEKAIHSCTYIHKEKNLMKLILERWNRFLIENAEPEEEVGLERLDILKWVSAHFPRYGNPLYSREAIEKMVKDFGYKSFEDFKGDSEATKLFKEISKNIYNNRALPKQEKDTVRINHTTGLRTDSPEERYSIIDTILNNGLVSQAEGSGKYSESPMDIFGLVDNPEAGMGNVYNKNFPWITLELPKGDERYQHDLRGTGPGSVVVLSKEVPAQYVIGVSGIPKNDYIEAVEKMRETQ